MAKDAPVHLHLGEVYDLASEIGKEFEKFIDAYGSETVKHLMTKVIVTLEYLESSIVIIENLQDELFDSKTRVQQLEYEKMEKAEFRNKFDQDLELIEENWKKEIDHLNVLVFKLQEENKRLCSSLANQESQSPNFSKVLSDDDLDVIRKLKVVADHHRVQLLDKDKELLQKSNDLDKFQTETERLLKVNKELLNKNKSLKKQLHALLDEKSDLQACMHIQRKEVQELQKQLIATIKENDDLSDAEGIYCRDFTGKSIIDHDDPNRPRFTLDELRKVFYERDSLKAKMNDLEEELNVFKLKFCPKPDCMSKEVEAVEDELPVQGPINREPEDKLYPEKKNSGIRRFFRFLRRFSMDSPVPIMPFSASPSSTGQSSCSGSSTCV